MSVQFGKKNAFLVDLNNRVFGTLARLEKNDSGEANYLDIYYFPLGAGMGDILLNKPVKYPHSIHKDNIFNDHAAESGLNGVEPDIIVLYNPKEDSMIRRIDTTIANELASQRKDNERLRAKLTQKEEEIRVLESSMGIKKGLDDENKDKRRGFPAFGEYDNTGMGL